MLARQIALQTSPGSSHTRPSLWCQRSGPLTVLAATLMDLPASIANKRLAPSLIPLDATLIQTFRRFDDSSCLHFRLYPSPTLIASEVPCPAS
jgi:hypothetical protein